MASLQGRRLLLFALLLLVLVSLPMAGHILMRWLLVPNGLARLGGLVQNFATTDQFMVARFLIVCCVADAIPVGLPVRYAEAIHLELRECYLIFSNFRAHSLEVQEYGYEIEHLSH